MANTAELRPPPPRPRGEPSAAEIRLAALDFASAFAADVEDLLEQAAVIEDFILHGARPDDTIGRVAGTA